MENGMIGSQITKFRKAAGLTQEELGRAVGVSTQAVSRWECGGAPDISLLPAIADKLGVAIDALFGREGGEASDIQKALLQWIQTVPKGQVIQALNRLPWMIIGRMPGKDGENKNLPYLENCEAIDEEGNKWLMCTSIVDDSGIYLGVNAEDMSFSTIFPKPEQGYVAYFSEHDTYRGLFKLLAKPGCLEMICCMLSQNRMYFSAGALGNRIGLDPGDVTGLLEQLEEMKMLDSAEVMLTDSPQRVYWVRSEDAFVPFLYLSRCLIQQGEYYYVSQGGRQKPML